MKYASNLIAPDLRPYFKLKDPPVQIMGHDIPSDPDFEPECGYFSDDEAAILYHVAKQVGGTWIDVGARFGWTAAHLMEAGCRVILVDPNQCLWATNHRLETNIEHWWGNVDSIMAHPFHCAPISPDNYSGFIIDGNHDDPEPLNDVRRADSLIVYDNVILMHDFWGAPIQRAVTWLMDAGYGCRIYDTPNGIALCWKMAGFVPPEHKHDPQFSWKVIRAQRCPDFDFSRCV